METATNRPNIPHILITPNMPENRPDPGMQLRDRPTSIRDARNVGNPDLASKQIGRSDASGEKGTKAGFWGSDGFTFGDLLDFINPLQHIPIVSTIYRAITGDEIGVGPRLFGGAILGGVVGVGSALVNAAVENETGKDLGGHALAAITGSGDKIARLASASAKPGTEQAMLAPSATSSTELPMEAIPEVADEELAAMPVSYESQQAFLPWKQNLSPDAAQILGTDQAHQTYRQAQLMDMLQKSALKMDA